MCKSSILVRHIHDILEVWNASCFRSMFGMFGQVIICERDVCLRSSVSVLSNVDGAVAGWKMFVKLGVAELSQRANELRSSHFSIIHLFVFGVILLPSA